MSFRQKVFLFLLGLSIVFTLYAGDRPLFALDGWHNNESGSPNHYQWALASCDWGSYCDFGTLIQGMGNDTVTLRQALTADVLATVSVLIIVDPDTPDETASPDYITPTEADAIEGWVKDGGVLLLLANDAGNCEITHLNGLSDRFGIHFNADQASASYDITDLPSHPFFEGCAAIHWVGVCTFTLSDSAQAEFTMDNEVLAASTHFGAGRILAFGDPIWYNEYINTTDNNRFAENVVSWLTAAVPGGTYNEESGPGHNSPELVCSPNPFSLKTTISITTTGLSAGISIFNLSGKQVSDLKTIKGNYSWDASGLPAGVYIIRAETGKTVLSKKVMLSR